MILHSTPEGTVAWQDVYLRDSGMMLPTLRPLPKPPDFVKASVNLWKANLPDARLRSFSHFYNCVGMIFASRSAWVEGTDLELALMGDGYFPLRTLGDVERGALILYKQDRAEEYWHAAVAIS